jgi:hypothetical protein
MMGRIVRVDEDEDIMTTHNFWLAVIHNGVNDDTTGPLSPLLCEYNEQKRIKYYIVVVK